MIFLPSVVICSYLWPGVPRCTGVFVIISRFRTIRRLVIDIADELRQVSVSQQLPNRCILTRVIPVVVDDPLKKATSGVIRLLVIEVVNLLQLRDRECIEKRISELRDGLPCFPHLGKRWCAGRPTIADQFVELWQWHQALQTCEPVPLLLPGHVTDIPTDAVHREDTVACINITEPLKPPLEFAACKAQLNDERMWHACCSFQDKNRCLFSRVTEKEDKVELD